MRDYTETNKSAFNRLAHEYNERWRKYLGHQETVLSLFEEKLRQGFEAPIRVLDVGCGVGLDSHILTEHGFQIYGIDIAEKMIEYAKQNVPRAIFEESNFFTYLNGQFQGIVMDAFLHLFPKEEVQTILGKAKSLLVSGGYGLICTTKNDESVEGYFEKEDYNGRVKRFRKHWTEQELKDTLKQNGLRIVDFYIDHEQAFNKIWMNALFQVGGE